MARRRSERGSWLLPLVLIDDDLFDGALKTAVGGAAGVDAGLECVYGGVEMGDSHLQPFLAIV